jgi:hypothetical protein
VNDGAKNNQGNGKLIREKTFDLARMGEVFTLADELDFGVCVSCRADVSPANLVEGLCYVLAQITRAALDRPEIGRVADLGLD